MTELTRRNFLKLSVVSAAASLSLGLVGCNDDGSDDPGILSGTTYFPQSLASGDPRPESVVLWTRIEDTATGDRDLTLRLQVATDAGFARLVIDQADFVASASHDHCIKIKVTDLDPDTVYFYRFLYARDNRWLASNTGRTHTAPTADRERPVRFASLNCQDYIGRYYNALAHLLEQADEPDFVVYLGDYIYETTGDPSFQLSDPDRAIQFSDPDSAIIVGSGEGAYRAANSVGNYRDLYKTYRLDPMLQQLHERFPNDRHLGRS